MFSISTLDDSVFCYWLLALGALTWEHLLFKKRAHEVLSWLLKQGLRVRELGIDGSRHMKQGF